MGGEGGGSGLSLPEVFEVGLNARIFGFRIARLVG